MQINDRDIIDWLLGLAATVGTLLTGLYWYIWRGDRDRIKNLEVKMQSLMSKPDVERIVDRMEESFKAEHRQILDELRDLRGEIISIIKQPWHGDERRGK